MGRGISQQQRQILGVAYHANRITQGEAKVKSGNPLKDYTVPAIDYIGAKDICWPLAVHGIHGITFKGLPSCHSWPHGREQSSGYFVYNGRVKSLKASVCRAIKTLMDRRLLVLAPHGDGNAHRQGSGIRWGYLLTKEGLRIGEEYEVEFKAAAYLRAGMVWFPDNFAFWRRCYHWRKSGESLAALLADPDRFHGEDAPYPPGYIYGKNCSDAEWHDLDNFFAPIAHGAQQRETTP